MAGKINFPILTAEEAAAKIQNDDIIAFSGFTPAGAAKAVPCALADRAREEHRKGREFRIKVLTGASSGTCLDEGLARARAISWRAPYQSSRTLRDQINRQEVEYVDMHLSHVPQITGYGFFGPIKIAVVEATEITADGRVFLATSIGASPTYLQHAEKVIIEVNRSQLPRLREMHDIYMVSPPPNRNPIRIFAPLSRIGVPYATVDPENVIGIVETDAPDDIDPFVQPGDISRRIADHLVHFFLEEMKSGRLPAGLPPLQTGVGNMANGVMAGLGEEPEIPPFYMYSEVFQDAMMDLMIREKILGASATSLTVTAPKMSALKADFDFFVQRIVLRPQEISNNPGIIRRLGVIALNTALEFDIYGNVNSSHLYGTDVVNGVGGSGEFTRNGLLSIFMAPSIARGGKVSAVVPMCPHIDNNEHSVQIVVTEQGLADLRGLGPMQRARAIIEKCAHPMYRDYLRKYLRDSRPGHIRHDLKRSFELHRNLLECGAMLPDLP